jgi:TM2 domain-containing membrane protein YozV
MKNSIKSAFLSLLFIVILVTSCTIEKRHYMPGYHVNRIGNKPITETKQINKQFNQPTNFAETKTQVINVEEPVLFASEEELVFTPQESKNFTQIPSSINNTVKLPITVENECDLIILRNGNEISAKVLEVGQNEVKYLLCENLNGPTYTKNKSEILKIKYVNGTSTIFEQSNQQNSSNSNNPLVNNSDNPNDKNLLVAIILWALLGVLGIHRFYLGHIGIGVLYLLTGGLCGIGWIIDGIMFLTGSLQPKNGKYVN